MTRSEDKRCWNLPMLAGALAVTLLLGASWFIPGPWRDAWDAIDRAVFLTLNGMLADNEPMAIFWALVNNRSFDLVPAFFFLMLFWRYMRDGGPRRETLERVASCGLMVFYLVASSWLQRQLLEIGRFSPSLVLEPSHLLTQIVPWIPTKDISMNSFPGDHGTVSIMLSIFLIRCQGRRMLGWAVFLIFISKLPRLVGGAHWLTDVVVGSLIFALPPMALLFATPLHDRLTGLLASGVRRAVPRAEPLLIRLLRPETPVLVGKGMCMGSADIIPGVSGGTMAYILGIYERLLGAITVFNRDWARRVLRLELRKAAAEIPILFLAPLGCGILLAVVIFTKMIPLAYFVEHHPEPIYGLFFGLVGGSVILLVRLHARLRLGDGLLIAAGTALGTLIVSLVPASTPDAAWFIFLCGALAISAMLLPGISGSFILLILGKYALIIGAIGSLDLKVLVPFALGCGVGLLAFAHSLRWLMKHHPRIMNLLIIGLLIGTLRAVWPFQNRTYVEIRGKDKLIGSEPFWPPVDAWPGLAGLLMLIGFGLIYLLHRLGGTKRA